MELWIEILTWVSIGSGGLLVFFLLLTIVGGLDFDMGEADADADAGGLGIFKSMLTFLSISAWVVKVILVTSKNPAIAIFSGIVAGVLAVLILTLILKAFINLQKDASWKPEMAKGKRAKVYLRIPEEGSGLILVKINGTNRELKAISIDNVIINTGAEVLVHEYDNGFAAVTLLTDK